MIATHGPLDCVDCMARIVPCARSRRCGGGGRASKLPGMSEPIEGDPGSPPDAPEPDSRDARRRFRQDVATGLTWTLIGTWGRQGIDLIVFAFLARLLLPEDFGLVALALVFVLLAQLLVDQGMGDALVQRREITPLQVDTA